MAYIWGVIEKSIVMEKIKYFHQPNISETLSNGWYTMKKYFLWLLLAVLVSGFVESPMKFTFDTNDFDNFNWEFAPHLIGFAIIAGLLALAIFLFVRPVLQYGADMMFVQAVRERTPDFRLLFQGFKENYLNIVLAHLLSIAIVGIGFACLLVPGIILACRLIFVSYLVMDKGLDPIRAIEESWRMTTGYGWTIFGLALLSVPIFIVGLICLIVGVFPAMIWVHSNFASLYQSILTHRENEIDSSVNRYRK